MSTYPLGNVEKAEFTKIIYPGGRRPKVHLSEICRPATLRACMYLRMSKDPEGNELGIARQREELARVLAGYGITEWVEYIDDDVSATDRTKRRPDYERMRRELDSYDVIAAWHLDRLWRRPEELESLIEEGERRWLTIATASGEHCLSTHGGQMVARITVAVARHEVQQKAERQRAAYRQMKGKGLPWRSGTYRPFGYAEDWVAVVQSEARWLREAYAWVVQRKPLAAFLAEYGHLAKTTAGNAWRVSVLRTTLSQPRYAGLTSLDKGGELIPAAWTAVVDEKTWREAVTVLATPTRRGRKASRLLSGLVQCGRCASQGIERWMYTAEGTATATKGLRVYGCRCGVRKVADQADRLVERAVVARLAAPDLTPDLQARSGVPHFGALMAERQAIEAKLERLADLLGREMMTEAEWAAARAPLAVRLATVQEELDRCSNTFTPLLRGLLAPGDPGLAERRWAAMDNLLLRRAVLRELGLRAVLHLGEGQAAFDVRDVEVSFAA